MFEKNDGKGVNAIQNKFTAMLKTALHNHKIDYIIKHNRIANQEFPLTDYTEIIGEEYDFMQAKPLLGLKLKRGFHSIVSD